MNFVPVEAVRVCTWYAQEYIYMDACLFVFVKSVHPARARKQREEDQHEGCGRMDPETLGHIRVHDVLSKRERLRLRTITAGSKFSGV